MEGFLFDNADAILLFWRTVKLYKIEDEKRRIDILRKCVVRNRAKYIRNPEELLAGKKILHIKKGGYSNG